MKAYAKAQQGNTKFIVRISFYRRRMKILKRTASKVIDMILRITEKKELWRSLGEHRKKWSEKENLLVKLFSEHFQLDELLSWSFGVVVNFQFPLSTFNATDFKHLEIRNCVSHWIEALENIAIFQHQHNNDTENTWNSFNSRY